MGMMLLEERERKEEGKCWGIYRCARGLKRGLRSSECLPRLAFTWLPI